MARVALVLVVLLVLLRLLLLFKINSDVPARRFRLSTLQAFIAMAVVVAYVAFGPKAALLALICGLAAILSISLLPNQRRPR